MGSPSGDWKPDTRSQLGCPVLLLTKSPPYFLPPHAQELRGFGDLCAGTSTGDTRESPRGTLSRSPLPPSLQEDAKEAIGALGSKEIRSLRLRSSWAFLTAKGFELPAGLQREEVSVCRPCV